MILADSAILQEIDKGNIIIHPFDAKCVGSNSYDVHLSPNLAVYRDVCKVYNGKPHLWEADGNWVKKEELFLDSREELQLLPFVIPEEGLILEPGILYLGSTVEYTETRNLVPYLEGKSSMGRLGIKVHVTAGKGDIGFKGHWTLEIEVTHPVKVYPGMKIAQLTYYRTEGFCMNPYNEKRSAKYNTVRGDDTPKASRNNLNFSGQSGSAYFERMADSGIAGIPEEDKVYPRNGDAKGDHESNGNA